MNRILSGLYAGFTATGPMTVGMLEAERALPRSHRSPLPPATLAFESAGRFAGKHRVRRTLSPEAQSALTFSAHYGYGALAGLGYSMTLGRLAGSPLAKGLLFGFGFWALNYLGIIPALGFRAAAHRMPISRNLMMVGAHLLWGTSLAQTEETLREVGLQALAGTGKAPMAE